MDSVTHRTDPLTVRGSWIVPVARAAAYAIATDFERMPERFPKLAYAVKVTRHDDRRLTVDVEAASFGRLFPRVAVTIEAQLRPDRGYRCTTFNRTFNTRGEEELLLYDDELGTRVEYSYVVTLERVWLRPLYGWLVRVFGLPYWKRAYLDPLTAHARAHRTTTPTG